MENIVLSVHLLLALALILTVLVQRSEGGGLGIGGGGGTMSGRPPASPMAKFTWILAIGFIITSLSLTWIATQNAAGDSVIERLGVEDGTGAPSLPPALEGDLTPPTVTGDDDGLALPPSE